MRITFRRYYKPVQVIRGATPRRIAAAKRALQRQREALPLFSQQIAESQPTPEERIRQMDDRLCRQIEEDRSRRADGWRQARTLLRSMSDRNKEALLDYWNRSHYPKDPSYLLGLIDRWAKGWRPEVLTDADLKRFEEGRSKVDELLARWREEEKIRETKYS